MQANYSFLFVGGQRDWRPLAGYDAPEGKVWEVRSLPGNVVAGGSTWDEAVENLQNTLDAVFDRAGSISDWFKAAKERMTQDDREDMKSHLMSLFETQGLSVESFTGNGYDYSPVQTAPCDEGAELCR